jgi:hypothetical protein
MSFDFSGAHLENLALEVPFFGKDVSFAGATFVGECQLWAPTFDGEVDFSDISVEGNFSLARTTLGANFLARRFSIAPAGKFSIGQTWTSGDFAQMIIENSTVSGQFLLSVHGRDRFKVNIDNVEAKTGAWIVIKSNDKSADIQWQNARKWMVHPGAKVWLPAEAAQLNMPWLKTSVARSGSVKFGDPPPTN